MAKDKRNHVSTSKQQPSRKISDAAKAEIYKEAPEPSEEEKVAEALVYLVLTNDYDHAEAWAKKMLPIERAAILRRSLAKQTAVP